MKPDETLPGNLESLKEHSGKIRFGASDGPRRKRKGKYDGSSPLIYLGHETVAQHLALPKSLRKFKSDGDIAKHFSVERMTVYRWKKDPDVIQRAYFLSIHNQMVGDLRARRAWPRIMQKAVEMASKGDLQAIKFCESRAWAEKPRVEQSQLCASVLIEDLFGPGEDDEAEGVQDPSRRTEGGSR